MPKSDPLFPEPKTGRNAPLRMTEPAVHWFTESTREETRSSPENVNRWYSDFPEDADHTFAKIPDGSSD